MIPVKSGATSEISSAGPRQIVVDALFNSVLATAHVYGGQTSRHDIRVPFSLVTFPYFDELVQTMIGSSPDGTRRWPIGQDIAVYFDVLNAPLAYTPAHREVAWSAISDWPMLIGGGAISTHEVYSEDLADVIVRWVPKGSLGSNTIGLCTLSYNSDYVVTRATIQLDVDYTGQLLRSLALHEFGHTLYLGHSPFGDDIMYYRLDPGVTGPSARELEAARILYSLPTKLLLEEPMRSGGARVVRVGGGGGEVTIEVRLDAVDEGLSSGD